MKTPASKKRTWLLLVLTCVYAAVLAALTAFNLSGADRFWMGALNLYLPQAAWAIPGILLASFFLAWAARWVWAPLLCLIWVIGPIMGLCWSTQMHETSSAGHSMRVISWNVKYGGYNKVTQLAIADDIREARPDLVLLQDAQDLLEGPIGRSFENWSVVSVEQYIVASRFPIDSVETRSIPFFGQDTVCLRCRLRVGNETVVVYNVHFESPRYGLNAFREVRKRPWYLPDAVQELKETVDARLSQAVVLGSLVRQEREPVLVGGDLNSPEGSLACATLREAGLHDAFSEGGRGYGYTYGHSLLQHRVPWFSASWMRIDHIMMSSQFRSYACEAGVKDVSEHRPVIADVFLEKGTGKIAKN